MSEKLISDAARDLIVNAEVSGKAHYEQHLRQPEWPQGQSGVTIGIGYDIGAGVSSKQQFWNDWRGRIPDNMIRVLEPCIGVTGSEAEELLPSVRGVVDVPWNAAIEVFDTVDVPRWHETCAKALPNFAALPLDCKGALVSLAYNRGPSFAKAGDRYEEMRNIKAHMAAKQFEKIPVEIRSMSRLWTKTSERGLPIRRNREAELFEQGLKQINPAPFVPSPIEPATPSAAPPWLMQMNAILGLYELPGERDNPAIIAMARACGGNIAKTYKHDSIAWCALTVNWCLISSGQKGDDSLWALDFSKYGTRLAGPAVGAIATKKREGGGHVFIVVGKTAAGKIVGRGGNQSDMVCDEVFDPSVIVAYTWPKEYSQPKAVGMNTLPVVTPAPKTRRDVTLPTSKPTVTPTPIATPAEVSAKPAPKEDAKTTTAIAAGGLGLAGLWAFAQEHMLVIVLGVLALAIVGLVAFRLIKGHWPWTSLATSIGDRLPAPSLPSLPRSDLFSAPLSRRLEESLAVLRATPSPAYSASSPRQPPSAKRSAKTRRRRKSSVSSTRKGASKSRRKQKSRSRG